MSLPIKTCAPYAWLSTGRDAAHPNVRPIWLAPLGNVEGTIASPLWRYCSTPSLWQGQRSRAPRQHSLHLRPFRDLILVAIIFHALAWLRLPPQQRWVSLARSAASIANNHLADKPWRAQLARPCATMAHHLRETRSEIISLRDRILRRHQRNQTPAYRLQRRLLRHAFNRRGASDGASQAFAA